MSDRPQADRADATLRVLHILHSFLPDSHGGIEGYVSRLARSQNELGVEATVLAGRDQGVDAGLLTEDRIGGLRVLRLPWFAFAADTAVIHRELGDIVADVLHRERIELVHVHHWHNATGDLIARSRRLGIPAVATVHDYFAVCPRFFRMREQTICPPDVAHATCTRCVAEFATIPAATVDPILRTRRSVFRNELEMAGALFTLSQDQLDYLSRIPDLRGLRFERVFLPRPDLAPRNAEVRVAGSMLRIVSWGGLVPGKGLHVLVDACERLTEPVAVDHYGRVLDPRFVDRVRGAARRTALTIHGSFDAAVMEREFPKFDLAVFPSLFRETYGYVVDEALLLGLPVVVPDRGAPRERIGSRGTTFAAGQPADLARVLAGFLADPGALPRMRAAAMPELMTMAAHARALRAVYDRVLADRA